MELATRRELTGLDDAARRSGLAASALVLAQVLDGTSPLTARDLATVAAEYRQTMAEVRRRAQPTAREDRVDQLRARREARRNAAG